MALKKTDTRNDYMKKYGSSLVAPELNQTKKEVVDHVANIQESTRLQMDAANEYADIVKRGKLNQNIFSDNALIQQQLRQETGPSIYDLMTEGEKEQFYYAAGVGGRSGGNEYLKEIDSILRKRAFENASESTYESSKENVLGGIANNAIASMLSGAGYVEDFARTIAGKELNPYSIGHMMSEAEKQSRQAIKDVAQGDREASAVRDFLIDTGLSMAQTVARMPLGGLGLVTAGLGAATQAEEDILARGGSTAQALLGGGAQGLAEGVFERFSLGNLKAMKETPVYAWKDLGKNLLKQMGVEASEEMATEFANTVTDSLIMGDKSNFGQSVINYMGQGMTENEAIKESLWGVAKNIGLAGIGGAISGGVLGAGANTVGALQQRQWGRTSDINDYQEIADTIDTDADSYRNADDHVKAVELQKIAQEFADQQKQGSELTDLQRGGFERDLYDLQRSIVESERNAAQIDLNEEEFQKKVVSDKADASDQLNVEKEDIQKFGAKLGEYGQKALSDTYDGVAPVEEFKAAFDRYYDSGRYNVDMEITERSALSAVLTQEQANAAWKAGAQDRNVAMNEMPRYKMGEAKTGSMIDLTGSATEAQKGVLTSVGKKTGLKFEIVDSTIGAQGSYESSTGTVRIALDSGNFLQTTSHELTHFIKDYAPNSYGAYKNVAISAIMKADGIDYDTMFSNYERRYREAGQNLTRDEIADEIVSDATGRFLNDKDFVDQIAREDRTIAQKIKDFIEDMIDSIKQLISNKGIRKAADALHQDLEFYESARDMWASALGEASEKYKSGLEIDASGNMSDKNMVRLSIATYENEGKQLLHDWLEKSNLDAETKAEIREQMDYVYDVATKYAKDGNFSDFSSWSETDLVRREDGSHILTVAVPNGDYPLNIDFSQVCKKRKALNSVLNALVRAGDLDFRTLSQTDIGNINRIIKEEGFEIACALCFVDSKRYRVNAWADSFAEIYNPIVESLARGTDLVADEFNFTGRDVKQPEGKLIKNAEDSELNFDYINEILAKNASGKAIYRYAMAIKNNKHLRSKLNSSEILSSAGLDPIRVQNEELYALINSHQGSAKPKLSHSEIPYGYDILLDKRFNAEDAYKVGGVRMQSFSDYMANMFFDYVQMIGDLSAKQLPAHAYTKEYHFARLYGLTGIKINLSIVPKGADITSEQKARFDKMKKAAKDKDPEFKALKKHAGLDKNGNYILEDETFPLDKALELQNMDGYDKNVGIIWVGVSDAHIEKMLDDDNVPFIIPYHKSSLNPAIARMRNIDFYNDYTKQQNTRYDSAAKKKVPSKIWSFDFYENLKQTGDPRKTAANYVRECKERGYLPKFDKWKDHPNYYKLLVDFRVYDKAGNYAPQGPVRMQFPSDFNEVVAESLGAAQETQTRFDASMSGLLDKIRAELNLGGQKLQLDNVDAETYDVPVDMDDVIKLRTIGRKSINDFSEEDIPKGEKWAYKFNNELGTKSPFFRAWFGDWRSHDMTQIKVLSMDNSAILKSGNAINADTGEKMSWNKDLLRESKLNANSNDKYDIEVIGSNIDKIVENGILLDTTVSQSNSNRKLSGTSWMHSFYCTVGIGNKVILVKLYAENSFSEKQNTSFTRAYSLKKIKKIAEFDGGVLIQKDGLTESHSTISINSVSDLFALVKKYDKDFKPKNANQKLMNSDGTPRVFYHQTDSDFTVFNTENERAGRLDTDTPTGMFFKPDDRDIGIAGNKQMAVYLKADNILEFKDREDAHKYWMRNVDGYRKLQNQYDSIDAKYDPIFESAEEETWKWYDEHYDDFVDGLITEEEMMEHTDKPLDDILYEWKREQEPIAREMKALVTKYMKNSGYDGMHLTYDGTRNNVDVETYIVFEPSQIKSATENIGTFNKYRNDIRYQLEDVDDTIDPAALMEENAALKKANELLTRQLTETKDYAPGLEDIKKISSRILKEYGSTYKQSTLENNLNKLYSYIKSAEVVDGEEVTRIATSIGKSIISNATMTDTTLRDQYKDLLKKLRSTKLSLPTRYWSDMESEGGYYDFRKRYFGKLRLSRDGFAVDEIYTELSAMYPELFDREIMNPPDQLKRIAAVVDDLRPKVSNPYHADIEELSVLIGHDILNSYYDVRSLKPTKMDAMQAKVYAIQNKYKQEMAAYKAYLQEQYESDLNAAEHQVIAELRGLKRRLDKLPKDAIEQRKELIRQIDEAKKNSGIDAERLAGKLKYQRKRDAAEMSKHKAKIIKDVTELAKWLEKPTDQKHVPEVLRVKLAEFLKEVDFSNINTKVNGDPGKRMERWTDLQDLFGKIINEGRISDAEGDYDMEVDPDLVANMMSIKSKMHNLGKLENFDLSELRTMRNVVEAMKRCIMDANTLYVNQKFKKVADSGAAFMHEDENRKQKREFAGAIGKIDTMLTNEMLDAQTMFHQMGPTAESFYRSLRDANDQKIRNTKVAQDYMQEILDRYNINSKKLREWTGKNAVHHLFKTSGGDIQLTTAQIMSLYALNQRKQAKDHMYHNKGGIKAAPTLKKTMIKKLDKEIPVYEIAKDFKPTKVTVMDVENITNTLTVEQKAFVDDLIKFFTTVTSEWGNEVSLKMYGYKKFMAPNYFPIVSDKNYIATRSAELERSITTLKNMGSTKSTVDKANNPIIIEDIFDVFTRQADQMGSYNAFVVPLTDLQKFLNFKSPDGSGSVKQSMERAFGKQGQRYIEELMKDINGSGTGTKDLTASMVRNMKAASVGANLRTAIQQPTAYVRAAAEMDPKYLIKGLTTKSTDWDKALEYAPIVQWKDWGYFDVNTGRSMKNIFMGPESLKEKLTEYSMWLTGKGDELAWRHLWESCKAETKALHPDLKVGSEEFYQQAGRRMSEIIDKTQVVDSVVHRTRIMKSDNSLVQMYTSFMSEPMKSYNMLYRAAFDAYTNPTSENKKRFTRIFITWGLSGVATALAAAVVDAMRDDDEEKDLGEKYIEAVKDNILDNLNPANMIPLARDVMSIFSGYQVQRTDMQAIQHLFYAVNKVQKYLKGDSQYTLPGVVLETTKAFSLLTGVAVSNAQRDLSAVVDTMLHAIGGFTGEYDLIYSKERMINDIESTSNLSKYVALSMKAYYAGDKDLGDRIIKDLKEAGIDDSKVEDKYKAILKDDPDVEAAAEARLSGDYEIYEQTIDDLEEQGMVRDYVISAIASVGNKIDPDANLQGDLYNYKDLTNAFRKSMEDFEKVYKRFVEMKKSEADAEGKSFDEKSVISSVKSRFTREYKERYRNGTDVERKEIRTLLYKLKINGQQLYSEKDFQDWMK